MKQQPVESFPEYEIWKGMKARCRYKKHKSYKHYGAKGVTVCERWSQRGGFRAFLEDMGRRPSPEHTLERVHSNRGYAPDNCVWATRTEQNNHRSNNVVLEFKGKRQTLGQWATELGLPYRLLQHRIDRGWPLERALTEPRNANRNTPP